MDPLHVSKPPYSFEKCLFTDHLDPAQLIKLCFINPETADLVKDKKILFHKLGWSFEGYPELTMCLRIYFEKPEIGKPDKPGLMINIKPASSDQPPGALVWIIDGFSVPGIDNASQGVIEIRWINTNSEKMAILEKVSNFLHKIFSFETYSLIGKDIKFANRILRVLKYTRTFDDVILEQHPESDPVDPKTLRLWVQGITTKTLKIRYKTEKKQKELYELEWLREQRFFKAENADFLSFDFILSLKLAHVMINITRINARDIARLVNEWVNGQQDEIVVFQIQVSGHSLNYKDVFKRVNGKLSDDLSVSRRDPYRAMTKRVKNKNGITGTIRFLEDGFYFFRENIMSGIPRFTII